MSGKGKAELMRRAAVLLKSPVSAYARGWLDGNKGLPPRADEFTRDYEEGWLQGAEEALPALPLRGADEDGA